MKIEDIAKLANVSKSAVSLALNGKPGVSDKTRENILKIIEEQNYIPLRNSKPKVQKNVIRYVACTNQAGIDERFSDLPFFDELLATLAIESGLENIETIISTLTSTNDLVEEIIKLELEKPTDALIVLGTNLTESNVKSIVEVYPNVVIIDNSFSTIEANFVSINNRLGAYQAVEHIAKMGHTQIGYARGEQRIQNFRERKKGFAKAVNDFNLNVSPEHIIVFGGMNIKVNSKSLEVMNKLDSWPTAIFCENDYIAISLIKTLNNFGKKIPEDISIVGFDNIGECEIIHPEITSISVNKEQLIGQTIKIIKNNILQKSDYKIYSQIGTSLVMRNSVKEIVNK